MTSHVLVRPRRSLVGTASISLVLGMLPVFGVLYWAGVQHHTWRIVLVAHIVLVVASLLVLVRQLSVFSAVSDSELSGRGIFSPIERVPLGEIASVTIVPTYVGQSPDPVKQLLVRDAAGHRLFRMRGNFWHDGDLDLIADALPVRTVTIKEPVSLSEFFRLYPGSAYWFENNPLVRIGIAVLAVLVAAGITFLLLSIVR